MKPHILELLTVLQSVALRVTVPVQVAEERGDGLVLGLRLRLGTPAGGLGAPAGGLGALLSASAAWICAWWLRHHRWVEAVAVLQTWDKPSTVAWSSGVLKSSC